MLRLCITLCARTPNRHPYRPTQYDNLYEQYHLSTIPYPVSIDQIPPIAERVEVNINVYSFYDDEGKARFPLYVSMNKDFNKCIDLLFWVDHYAWIKYFSSFMADIVRNHTVLWCRACLGHFDNEKSLKTHKDYCEGLGNCRTITILPEAYQKLRFENQAYVQLSL